MNADAPPADQLDAGQAEADETAEDVRELLELETQKRLWVRTLIPLLQLRSHDSDPSGRVQLAFDLMHISVCDRIRSLLQGSQ